MESLFLNPEVGRADLAQLLSDIQTQEKQKLHLVSSHLLKSGYLMVEQSFNLLNEASFFADRYNTGTEEGKETVRTNADT